MTTDKTSQVTESVFESLAIVCIQSVQREAAWIHRFPALREVLERGDTGALHGLAPLTTQVGIAHGKSNAYVLRHLHALESQGRVMCSSHPGWTSRWWIVGLADALNATKVTEASGRTFYTLPPLDQLRKGASA